MRRAFLFLAALALAASLAGCAATSATTSTTSTKTSTSATGLGTASQTGADGTTTTAGGTDATGTTSSAGTGTPAGDDTTTTTSAAGQTSAGDTSTNLVSTTTTVPITAASDPATVTHEQSEARFVYAGGWKTSSAAQASGGSYAVASSSGSSLTIRFIGTHLAWIAKEGPAYGEATVTVDGGTPHVVNLYSKTVTWKHTVWQTGTLSRDAHTVVISYSGKKAAASTGRSIDVDAISITGVATGRYQQSDSQFTFAGSWKKSTNSLASGGSFVYADTKGASVTIRFKGIDLAWIAKKGPSYGEAKVIVDGGKAVTVDLYNSSSTWQKRVWSTGILASDEHTVKIEWTGSKHKGASAANVDIDALDVTGTLL